MSVLTDLMEERQSFLMRPKKKSQLLMIAILAFFGSFITVVKF